MTLSTEDRIKIATTAIEDIVPTPGCSWDDPLNQLNEGPAQEAIGVSKTVEYFTDGSKLIEIKKFDLIFPPQEDSK